MNKLFPHLKFKLLLVGGCIVGKTNIISKYVEDKFYEITKATMGFDYKTKTIFTDKYKITLNIWDSAGPELFKQITNSFLTNTNGVIYVYDITNSRSFNEIKERINETYKLGNFESILVGNKLDLDSEREVKFDTLKEYGLKQNIKVIEVSSKTGVNIDKTFKIIVEQILNKRSNEELLREFGVAPIVNFNLKKAKQKKVNKIKQKEIKDNKIKPNKINGLSNYYYINKFINY